MQSRSEIDIVDSLNSFKSNDIRYENIVKAEIMRQWMNLLCEVMNGSDKASLIISAACTGLIRQLLPYTKEDNINMNIVGNPACGKSTITHFALSLFGDPQVLEASFSDSQGAMELNRVERTVIPCILDERMLRVEDK